MLAKNIFDSKITPHTTFISPGGLIAGLAIAFGKWTKLRTQEASALANRTRWLCQGMRRQHSSQRNDDVIGWETQVQGSISLTIESKNEGAEEKFLR